jgi:hypothetical protein
MKHIAPYTFLNPRVLVSASFLLIATLCVYQYTYAQEDLAPQEVIEEEQNPFAVTEDLYQKRAEARKLAIEEKEDMRTKARETMEAFTQRLNAEGLPQARLSQEKQSALIQRLTSVSARMNSFLDTMLQVANNAEAVSARIEQENSVNMNIIRTLTAEMRGYADVVRSDIAEFSNLSNAIVVSDDPRAMRGSLEESARMVGAELKIMHEILVEIRALILDNATVPQVP